MQFNFICLKIVRATNGNHEMSGENGAKKKIEKRDQHSEFTLVVNTQKYTIWLTLAMKWLAIECKFHSWFG